jgi:hypothetical protein
VRAREIAGFDAGHDALWREASRDLTCAVVRDASYLNWKYVEQPGQTFVRLEVADGDVVKGVAVLTFREPDAAYRYRRAWLVDAVTPLSDDRWLGHVLQSACQAAAERGADAVECLHVGPRLTRGLKRAGFFLRTPQRFLLVDPGPLTGSARDAALGAEGWFVTQGDSDIDRP